MKKYNAPQTLCAEAVAEQMLALSIIEGNANPENEVLEKEQGEWNDIW